MAVRIRLARLGHHNRPFYRVVAADSRSTRDGKQLEVLGFYDPLQGKDGEKRMGLKVDRVKYWLSVGAQPSEPVQRILFRAGILPRPPMLAIADEGRQDSQPVDTMSDLYLTIQGIKTAAQPKGVEGEKEYEAEAKQSA